MVTALEFKPDTFGSIHGWDTPKTKVPADNLTPFGRKKHVIQGVPKKTKTIEINVLLVNFMHKKPFKKLF